MGALDNTAAIRITPKAEDVDFMNRKHPGFKAVQKKIAGKAGVSMERAGAILAASSRRASPAAKKKNPRLKRVSTGKRLKNAMRK